MTTTQNHIDFKSIYFVYDLYWLLQIMILININTGQGEIHTIWLHTHLLSSVVCAINILLPQVNHKTHKWSNYDYIVLLSYKNAMSNLKTSAKLCKLHIKYTVIKEMERYQICDIFTKKRNRSKSNIGQTRYKDMVKFEYS